MSGCNHEQAVRGLDRFERIWLVFGFHQNGAGSRMIVRPPGSEVRVGVFATRSPHRPNQLGLSCVRLVRVAGLDVFVSEVDILDGSPVYDIKPYVPTYDSFPDSVVPEYAKPESRSLLEVRFTPLAEEQIACLSLSGGPDLKRYAILQLSFEPLDSRRRRVSPAAPYAVPGAGGSGGTHSLAFRMWRIPFTLLEEEEAVVVLGLFTGYSADELQGAEDPHGDKDQHRGLLSGSPMRQDRPAASL